MEKINLIKPEKINLKDYPTLNEHWLQDIIAKDPEILGLGRKRKQHLKNKSLILSDRIRGVLFEN